MLLGCMMWDISSRSANLISNYILLRQWRMDASDWGMAGTAERLWQCCKPLVRRFVRWAYWYAIIPVLLTFKASTYVQ